MILTYADLKSPEKFVCPWHMGRGGACGQSLAGASVLSSLITKKFVPIEQLVDEADAGERVIFWCPKCEGAVYVAPVEQGFKVGIPSL